jgi:hypothetical protein
MNLLELHQRITEVDKDRLIDECLSQLKGKVIELNLSQLDQGLNAEGKKFRPYVNGSYARMKNRMNPKPGLGNPDLKKTGDFWKAFKADLRLGVMDIYSEDQKAAWLEDGTTKMKPFLKIYGLTEDNLNVLRAEFLILFNDRFRAEVGLQ